jgi:N-acyl-D-amino-acid deacylase
MRKSNADRGHQDYSFAMVASCRRDPSIEGKTVTEINRAQGGKPGIEGEIQVILDLLARDPTGTSMIYHTMSMVDVERIMKYPLTAIASDGQAIEEGVGSPHPRGYGTNACVLAEFVRERHVLTLEEAIRRMTQLPAAKFGFEDRGQIREGAAADLVLFDPEKIQDHATYTQPHQYSTGFDLVVVNGQIEVEADKLTGVHAGQVLRHRPL